MKNKCCKWDDPECRSIIAFKPEARDNNRGWCWCWTSLFTRWSKEIPRKLGPERVLVGRRMKTPQPFSLGTPDEPTSSSPPRWHFHQNEAWPSPLSAALIWQELELLLGLYLGPALLHCRFDWWGTSEWLILLPCFQKKNLLRAWQKLETSTESHYQASSFPRRCYEARSPCPNSKKQRWGDEIKKSAAVRQSLRTCSTFSGRLGTEHSGPFLFSFWDSL